MRYNAFEYGLSESITNTFRFSDPNEVCWIRSGGCKSIQYLSASEACILVYSKKAKRPTYNMTNKLVNTVNFETGGELRFRYTVGIYGLVSGRAMTYIKVTVLNED